MTIAARKAMTTIMIMIMIGSDTPSAITIGVMGSTKTDGGVHGLRNSSVVTTEASSPARSGGPRKTRAGAPGGLGALRLAADNEARSGPL